MINFSLRQLTYALAIEDTGLFAKAAEKCFVTQSALSQQIKLLEEACGATLFERSARGVQTTPFGREFLSRAREVVKSANELGVFAAGHKGRPKCPIRFGLIPTVAPYLLPEIYPDLRAALPDVEFTISESRTESLLEQLESGALHIALIATEPPPGARLEQVELFNDPFVLAYGAKDSQKAPIALSAVPSDRMLLLDEGHCLRDQAIEACHLSGQQESRAFAATSLSTIVEFVAHDQGVTLLPSISLKKEAADPRIHIAPLASPGAGRTLRLVWRQGTPFAELFREIGEVIKDGAAEKQQRRAALA